MIDIERLRETAMEMAARGTHWDGCLYSHAWCAMVPLIERLEVVERELGHACQQHEEAARRRMDAEAQQDWLEDNKHWEVKHLGPWLSAAQEDPAVCPKFKTVIEEWMRRNITEDKADD